MTYVVRPYRPAAAEGLSALFADYMAETYGGPNRLTPQVLAREHGRSFELTVAVDGGEVPIAFGAWVMSYDLHNAVSGGHIHDFYVARSARGRGLAVRLTAEIARALKARGGVFLSSVVLPDDTARTRLAGRWGVSFTGAQTYLAPPVFEAMADLGGAASARALVRRLQPLQLG